MKKLLLLVLFAIVLNSCNKEDKEDVIAKNTFTPTNTKTLYTVEKIGKCEGCKNDIYMSVLTFKGKKILLLEGYSSNIAIPLD